VLVLVKGRSHLAIIGKGALPSFADWSARYPNVRPLCHHLDSGCDQGVVRLQRAARFPSALQRSANPTRSDSTPCRQQARICAGALGVRPRLGEGPKDLLASRQCAGGIRARQAGLSQRHAATALPRPADGFYEWRSSAPKRPYFVQSKSGGPIAFAGLWETWSGPNGEEVDTAAIVTTRANRTLATIHDRMPVIVAPEAFNLWLDCRAVDTTTAAALIAPAPESLLACYEVSPAVNSVASDDARLIAPLTEAKPARSEAAEDAAAANQKKRNDQPSLF